MSQGGTVVVNANQQETISLPVAYTQSGCVVLLGNDFKLMSISVRDVMVVSMINNQARLPWATLGW